MKYLGHNFKNYWGQFPQRSAAIPIYYQCEECGIIVYIGDTSSDPESKVRLSKANMYGEMRIGSCNNEELLDSCADIIIRGIIK